MKAKWLNNNFNFGTKWNGSGVLSLNFVKVIWFGFFFSIYMFLVNFSYLKWKSFPTYILRTEIETLTVLYQFTARLMSVAFKQTKRKHLHFFFFLFFVDRDKRIVTIANVRWWVWFGLVSIIICVWTHTCVCAFGWACFLSTTIEWK